MDIKGQNIIIRTVLQKLFVCKRCGDCCKSTITLVDVDIENMRKNLKVSRKTFLRKFTDKMLIEGKLYVCLKKKGIRFGGSSHENECSFYINGNCKIYSFRPSICKVFPFMALRDEGDDLEESPFRKFLEGCCPGTKDVTGKEWVIKRIMEREGIGEKDAILILNIITEQTTNELVKLGIIDKNRNYIKK